MKQTVVSAWNTGKRPMCAHGEVRASCFAVALLGAFLASAATASAAEISVVGLFPGKSAIVIDGGKLQVLDAGQAASENIRLLDANAHRAVFQINGRREIIALSQHIVAISPSPLVAMSVAVQGDARGMFTGSGSINGHGVSFLLDTGASLVTLPVAIARAIDLDYIRGTPAVALTASGTLPAYKIKLSTVRMGEILARDVDALVVDTQAFNTVLLGMSFLNRVEMKRDGDKMIFMKRSQD